MSLSGEVCLASGPCVYGSRTEVHSERAGDVIEPYGDCARQGSRTEGGRESAGITTGPYRDSGSASGSNAWRDGTEVSRSHSSRATLERARGEGPNMRSQGGAVDGSPVSMNPPGGDASRRDATQPALLHDDLMERVQKSENMRRAWQRVKANKGTPGIDGIHTLRTFPSVYVRAGQRKAGRCRRCWPISFWMTWTRNWRDGGTDSFVICGLWGHGHGPRSGWA